MIRKVVVVLANEPDCDHEEVDVMEDQCLTLSVEVLLLHEVHGLLAPMSQRVQMMAGVIAIVERESIALCRSQSKLHKFLFPVLSTHWHVDKRDAGPQVVIRVNVVHESVLSPIADH